MSDEVAVAEYGQRSDGTRHAAANGLIDESKDRRPSFAERHFHLVPQHVSGRSLRTEDVATFDLVENMCRTRNKVAHEGRLYYRGGDGREVTVDQVAVVRFLAASERVVTWLSRL